MSRLLVFGGLATAAVVAVALVLVSVGRRGGSDIAGALTPTPTPLRTATAGRTVTATPASSPAATNRTSTPVSRLPRTPERPASGEQATVTHVVDGDTIDVRRADGSTARIRYIGMNTPESVDPRRPVECFGKEASSRNAQLVAGKTVTLQADVSDTDQYGRLLRYVWLGDTFVNGLLVQEGFARAYTFPPDVRYADWFRAQEAAARAANKGLWGGCPR